MTEYNIEPSRPAMTVSPTINEVTGEHTGFNVSSSNHFAEPVQLQEYQPDHLNSMQTPDDMIAESLGQLYPNLEAAMYQFVPQLDEDEKYRLLLPLKIALGFLTPKFEEWSANYDPSLDSPNSSSKRLGI